MCSSSRLAARNVEIAVTMVNRHRALLDIPGRCGRMPLYMACLYGQREMAKYLYGNSKKMSGDYWTNEIRGRVLRNCVQADLFAKYYYTYCVVLLQYACHYKHFNIYVLLRV